jgi:mannan endo-1,4-beta-mannosidase
MRLLIALTCLLLFVAIAKPRAAAGELNEFVTRRGDQLFEGDKPFRFISVNIPNLQLVEDNFAPGAKTAWTWPNEFELTDALESVRQMGGTVVRTYVLSVRRAGSDMGEHVYVRGPGDFNEEAFRALDLALEIANRKGVRVIIPLVDNWKWQGGIGEYAAFRSKPPEAFWSDEQVIADFEGTVRHVLNRVNTRTGVAYRDDPAIFGWETGNELDSPPTWTRRIAALMKKLDPNHLVIDGYSLHGVRDESLADPNIDVITTHHYPNTDTGYVKPILAARERTRGKKPYFVGEFGFVAADEIEEVYDTVIDNGISGALLWSLRFHHRDGGFYWHFEPSGGAHYKAYHWPGFDGGEAYDERRVMQMTRAKAYEIRGVEPPTMAPPQPPRLLTIDDVAAISWRGSAGAQDYVVERAVSNDEPWTIAGDGVDDSAVQYRPLFNDASASPGASYFYRVRARNAAGESEPSNVVGPVTVAHRTLVDEGQDLSRVASKTGDVKATTGEDRRRREDVHRIAIPAGGSIVYEVDEPIVAWRALLFREGETATVTASVSADGSAFEPAGVEVHSEPKDSGDYGYLGRLELQSISLPAGMRFLRLEANGGALELSRLEIQFGPKSLPAGGSAAPAKQSSR